MPDGVGRLFLSWAAVHPPADEPLLPRRDRARPILDRRRFLLAGAGATAAVFAGCSTAGDSPNATAVGGSGPDGSVAPGATSPAAPDVTAAPTTTGAGAAPADGALAAPGSPGLVDEVLHQQHVDEYLAFATRAEPTGNPAAINAFLVRAHREPDFTWPIGSVTVESLAAVFEPIDAWRDARAVALLDLLWMLALGDGDDGTAATEDGEAANNDTTDVGAIRLAPDVIAAIDQRLLANRYRFDDPLPDGRIDDLWYWSEHHRIVTLAVEYLAGQRHRDEVFAVTGLTGSEHLERARPDIVAWIDERAELGFFEWHSHVYMLQNIAALATLAELSDDPEIVVAAAMALDLCLLDMAAHNHANCYTAPRGRTYKQDKMTSLDEDTWGVAKLVFADTDQPFQSSSDRGVVALCAASRYRPPRVAVEIATDDNESVVREMHGVYFDGSSPVVDDPAAPYGRDFDDPDNLTFWWSLGAVAMWPLAETGVAAADANRLWDTTGLTEFAALADLNDRDPARIAVWEQERAAAVNSGFLSAANTYAYRDANVSLASVLDHRFGELRDDAHSWQAAIDERALVFTTHPVTDVAQTTVWGEDPAPGYWTGEASMPRSAQHRRTAIHVYQPAWDESTDADLWATFGYQPFTHAYVPQDHFDEVRQVGNWTVVAKSGGFIALWSWRTPTWREYDPTVVATNGMHTPFDLVAEGGPDNVWIVEVGSDDGGSFDEYVAAVTAIDPSVVRDDAGFAISWTSPSSGLVDFSSTGPFLVEGVEQPLGGHARHESPWGIVDRTSRQYNLVGTESTWSCDFEAMTRAVT